MYDQARNRIIDLIEGAPPEALERTVPATPDWTGRQLLAHLAGVPADLLAGNLEGAGTPAWTGPQVAQRADATVADLVAEWRGSAEAFGELLRNGPEGLMGALGADVVQHELDLRGLLGAPVPESADIAVDKALNFMVGFLDRRVKKAELPALRLSAGNQEWTFGPGDTEPGAALATSTVELFRIVAGRRSEAQVRALDWSGDPTPYLPVLSAFGPLAAADVAEPSLI